MLAVPQVRIGQRDAIGVVIKIHFSTPLRSHRQPWLKNLEIEASLSYNIIVMHLLRSAKTRLTNR